MEVQAPRLASRQLIRSGARIHTADLLRFVGDQVVTAELQRLLEAANTGFGNLDHALGRRGGMAVCFTHGRNPVMSGGRV